MKLLHHSYSTNGVRPSGALKAIFSVMRNVWNLRPAHMAEPVTKIELIHAKSSDFAAYEPRAVDFDPNTFTYRVDPTFSHETWQYELERAKRNGSSLTSEQRTDAYKRQGDEMRRKILEFVISRGHLYRSELEEWMYSQGMAKNKALTAYSGLVENGALAKITVHGTSKVIVGTPAEIYRMLSEAPPGTYRS